MSFVNSCKSRGWDWLASSQMQIKPHQMQKCMCPDLIWQMSGLQAGRTPVPHPFHSWAGSARGSGPCSIYIYIYIKRRRTHTQPQTGTHAQQHARPLKWAKARTRSKTMWHILVEAATAVKVTKSQVVVNQRQQLNHRRSCGAKLSGFVTHTHTEHTKISLRLPVMSTVSTDLRQTKGHSLRHTGGTTAITQKTGAMTHITYIYIYIYKYINK